jgi:hypothetical protein
MGARDRVLALREAILDVVEGPWSKGDQRAYLKVLAEKYPVAFAGLLGRLLPKKMEVEGEQRVDIMFPCDSPEELSRKAVEALRRAREEA